MSHRLLGVLTFEALRARQLYPDNDDVWHEVNTEGIWFDINVFKNENAGMYDVWAYLMVKRNENWETDTSVGIDLGQVE